MFNVLKVFLSSGFSSGGAFIANEVFLRYDSQRQAFHFDYVGGLVNLCELQTVSRCEDLTVQAEVFRNQDFAELLYADMQSKGVRCWYAPEDLKIGDMFRRRIDESIRTHEKLLLILSKDSVESQWVEKEVETAMERERQRGHESVVLFPIKLDDAILDEKSGWAADVRRTKHIGDFRGWKNHDEYRKAFDRLLRDLRAESPRREGDTASTEPVTG